MDKTTPLWEAIGAARMAVYYGLQEIDIRHGMTHVRVWREGPGIEGIKVNFLPNS